MNYWREESFDRIDTLNDRLQQVSELSDYRAYLRLLHDGLRKEALKHIEDLLSTLRGLPKGRQRELASLLCRETQDSPGHVLMPHPLRRRFIQPVLHEWKLSEPHDPEPFRWTGDVEDLLHSLDLDPSCVNTRRRLVRQILNWVGYSAHELPSGYLGDIDEDLQLLTRAKIEATLLPEEDGLLARVEKLAAEVVKYRNEGNA